MMTVTSKQEAWNKVNEIFPTDYEQDMGSSDRAGYPVYRSTAEGHYYDYICDLGSRLEVNWTAATSPPSTSTSGSPPCQMRTSRPV